MRYLIVSLIPPHIDQALREAYRTAFNEDINIKHLHLSYLPPFFLSTSVNVEQLKSKISNHTPSGTVAFAIPQIFAASHHPTLVLPLIPKAPLSTLNTQLESSTAALIDFDLSVYKDAKVPTFDPHISLSYNFTHPDTLENFDYPKEEFILSTPVLLEETAPTQWQIV